MSYTLDELINIYYDNDNNNIIPSSIKCNNCNSTNDKIYDPIKGNNICPDCYIDIFEIINVQYKSNSNYYNKNNYNYF